MDQLIYLFSTIGVFHGILLSLYLFFFARYKSLSKVLLGALILALSIRLGKSILLYFDRSTHKAILQVGLSACLFIGPLLFFYLRTVLRGLTQMPRHWKQLLIGMAVLIVIVGAVRPYHLYPDFWNTYVVQSIYSIWFLSVLLCGIMTGPILVTFFTKPSHLIPIEKWLLGIYLGNVIIAASYFMAFFGFSALYYISGPMVFTLFLYLLVFGYFNRRWFDIEEKPRISKYSNRKIPSAQVQVLTERLRMLMQDDQVFKQPNLKLRDLAELMGMTSHQLSQLLNDNLERSFKDYINQHRIAAACEMIQNDQRLSLEGIGYEVGFRSKSTFFTTFKKQISMTPAQYKSSSLAESA